MRVGIARCIAVTIRGLMQLNLQCKLVTGCNSSYCRRLDDTTHKVPKSVSKLHKTAKKALLNIAFGSPGLRIQTEEEEASVILHSSSP